MQASSSLFACGNDWENGQNVLPMVVTNAVRVICNAVESNMVMKQSIGLMLHSIGHAHPLPSVDQLQNLNEIEQNL